MLYHFRQFCHLGGRVGGVQSNCTEIPHSESPSFSSLNSSHDINALTICEHVDMCIYTSICVYRCMNTCMCVCKVGMEGKLGKPQKACICFSFILCNWVIYMWWELWIFIPDLCGHKIILLPYTCQKRGENQMTLLCLLCIKKKKKGTSVFLVPRLKISYPTAPNSLRLDWPPTTMIWSPHPAQLGASVPICGSVSSQRGFPTALRGQCGDSGSVSGSMSQLLNARVARKWNRPDEGCPPPPGMTLSNHSKTHGKQRARQQKKGRGFVC